MFCIPLLQQRYRGSVLYENVLHTTFAATLSLNTKSGDQSQVDRELTCIAAETSSAEATDASDCSLPAPPAGTKRT